MLVVGISHYLTVSAILFTIGVFGIFLNRRNVIVILMSIELILLAVKPEFRGILGRARRYGRPVFAPLRSHRRRRPKPPSDLPYSSSSSATAVRSRSRTST